MCLTNLSVISLLKTNNLGKIKNGNRATFKLVVYKKLDVLHQLKLLKQTGSDKK